ncbi:TonB-dependent vitamin B12 receptor [Lysobacter yangpyeongensis]|uniref:TonB-dependent vitamin B12 receptor n=1 Tax=Lysobacter yangpyeongensis TaxID=346182 RepID=A0ABW0SN60_9GAMM
MQSPDFRSFRRSPLAAGLLCALVAGASMPALAADGSVQATDVDDVIVTASRTAQTQDATLASVSVITREEIDRLQPASLPDLLRGQAGLSISNNGGMGKESSLFLRGTESDHTIVLVDGIKIGSATAGKAALQDIPVDQIERIEIVRGPYSSLYGSEALGGVIQIFTRRPRGAFSPNFSIAVGSHDTARLAAGVGGRGANGWYSVNAAHERTEGIDSCRGAGFPVFAGCFTVEPDKDAYRNTSLSAQGGYTFNEQWEAEARILRAEGRNEYDGDFQNRSSVVEQVAHARVRYRPVKALTLTFDAGASADLSDDFKDANAVGYFDTHRRQGALQADIATGAGLFTVGFDWMRDRVDSDAGYPVTQRVDRAAFGQWQQTFGAQSLQLNVRRDDDDQFGGKTTGAALWGWDLTDTLRFTASYGTAYKAPSFNELYFPFFGNPDLDPETSRSAELGLRGQHAWGSWSVNAFQTRVDDLIGYDPTPRPGLPFGGAANIDRARIRGVELGGETTLAGWNLHGTATWLDPRDDAGADIDNVLPRRARRSARLDADRRFGAFNVGASVSAQGPRYDDPANLRRMGGYATTDLRIGYALTPAWTVQVNADNVFDKRYETAAFYNQPGRTWLLSVRYRPVE